MAREMSGSLNGGGYGVAFINYSKNGMLTLIESPEIADAMRQMFLFCEEIYSQSYKSGRD